MRNAGWKIVVYDFGSEGFDMFRTCIGSLLWFDNGLVFIFFKDKECIYMTILT